MTGVVEPSATRRTGERPFAPRDLARQVLLTDPCLAPDGATAFYGRRTIERGRYVDRIWSVPSSGGAPACLSGARTGDRRPRVSPDGARIAFVATADGGARLALTTVAGGGFRLPVPGLVGVQAAEWLPDGRLAVLAPSGIDRFLVGDRSDPVARRIRALEWRRDGAGVRDQFTALWLVDPERGTADRLTDGQFDVQSAAPGPGSTVLVIGTRERPDGTLALAAPFSVSPRDPGLQALSTVPGAVLAGAWHEVGGIAYLGRERVGAPDAEQVGMFIDAGAGPVRADAGLDRPVLNTASADVLGSPPPVAPPVWLDDRSVAALVTDGPSVRPYAFSRTHPPEALVAGDAVTLAVCAAAGVVVGLVAAGGRGTEVCRIDRGRAVALTSHGSAWYRPYRRSPARRAVRHREGHAIDSWWLAADAPVPGPTVLHIHGGPASTHVGVPPLELIALRDAGIHVAWANPRGSHGYGTAFAADDATAYGEAAASDLSAVVDDLVVAGLADRARLGVLGHSYGGYMALWLLGHHPGLFAAGVVGSPVSDFVSKIASSDTHAYDQWLGETLPEDAPAFLARSPYLAIHRNRAPVLLIQPDDDLRCPPGQSDLVFQILLQHGATVEMVRYPGESHGMPRSGRLDRRIDRLERIVDWFTRSLVPDAQPSTGRGGPR